MKTVCLRKGLIKTDSCASHKNSATGDHTCLYSDSPTDKFSELHVVNQSTTWPYIELLCQYKAPNFHSSFVLKNQIPFPYLLLLTQSCPQCTEVAPCFCQEVWSHFVPLSLEHGKLFMLRGAAADRLAVAESSSVSQRAALSEETYLSTTISLLLQHSTTRITTPPSSQHTYNLHFSRIHSMGDDKGGAHAQAIRHPHRAPWVCLYTNMRCTLLKKCMNRLLQLITVKKKSKRAYGHTLQTIYSLPAHISIHPHSITFTDTCISSPSN